MIALDISVIPDIALKRGGEMSSLALVATRGKQNEAWPTWRSVVTSACPFENQEGATSVREFVAGLLSRTRQSGSSRRPTSADC